MFTRNNTFYISLTFGDTGSVLITWLSTANPWTGWIVAALRPPLLPLDLLPGEADFPLPRQSGLVPDCPAPAVIPPISRGGTTSSRRRGGGWLSDVKTGAADDISGVVAGNPASSCRFVVAVVVAVVVAAARSGGSCGSCSGLWRTMFLRSSGRSSRLPRRKSPHDGEAPPSEVSACMDKTSFSPPVLKFARASPRLQLS